MIARLALLLALVPALSFGGDWRTGDRGYEDAVFDQKQTGQPLIVYFATPWCGYCTVLEKNVLQTKKVRDALGAYAKVKINPEDSPDAEMIARKFGVSGYPSVFVVPPGNKFPEKVPASGAAGPDAFIAAVQRAAGVKTAPVAGKKEPAPVAAAPAVQESMKVAIPASLLKDLPGDVVEQQAQGRHDAVVTTLSAEIKRAEKNGIKPKAGYYYARALSYRAQRKHSDAAADLEAYLKAQPDDVAARETLARSYLNVTLHEDAAAELERLVETHPTPERKWLLAEAYSKSGRAADAKPLYESACAGGYAAACPPKPARK